MCTQIYQSADFKIYKAGDGYIIHNTHKKFKEGHTHVKKYDTCMIMIKLIKRKLIPKSRSKHFIESLLRLSHDKKYNSIIMECIQ